MSKTLLLTIISAFILMLLSCVNPTSDDGPVTGTMTDIEGNVYQTVKIGNQWWMAEDLRTTKYNDSTPIPHITDSAIWANLTTPGYCYYNNTTNEDSIKKFGALYNWYTVHTKKLAPAGWHVPDTTDWNILQNYLIANGYNWDGTTDSNMIAKSLAAQTDWLVTTDPGSTGNDLTKNNSSGFSALPGGCRDLNGGFYYFGVLSSYWSVTEADSSDAYDRFISYASSSFYEYDNNKSGALSVRLVKD